ncbi:uncharacterized protein Dvar_02010 [Desulfosarcina variabilis str. Montpellier]
MIPYACCLLGVSVEKRIERFFDLVNDCIIGFDCFQKLDEFGKRSLIRHTKFDPNQENKLK